MLVYIVTMWSGRRTTVRAEEARPNFNGHYEFLVLPAATIDNPHPARQVVALFAECDVMSIVAKEFFVSEETVAKESLVFDGTAPPVPHVIGGGDDPIPF